MGTLVLNESRAANLPTIEILSGGKPLPERFFAVEADIELTTASSDTGSARLIIRSDEGISGETDAGGLLAAFPLAGELTLKLGYEGKNSSVFEGIIFERAMSLKGFMTGELAVTALDKKSLLRLNNNYACHTVKSCSALLDTIAAKYRLNVKAGTLPKFQNPAVFSQNGATDFDFLQKLAMQLGCEFYVFGQDLYFRSEKDSRQLLAKLGRGIILNLEHRSSLSGLYSEVSVTACNQDDCKSEQILCDNAEYKIGSGKTPSDIYKKAGYVCSFRRSMYIGGDSAFTPKELASAILQRNSMGLTVLTVKADGIPELIPGGLVELEDVADGIDGTYYLKMVRHIYGDGEYTTVLTCVSNTAGV